MDSRDRELLDKQLRRLRLPPRRDGVMILAIVGVFLAGMTAGGLLFANRSGPQTASSDGNRVSLFLERLADCRPVSAQFA